MTPARWLLLCGAAALSVACGGSRAAVRTGVRAAAEPPAARAPRERTERVLPPPERIDEVIAQARELLGKHMVQVQGRSYRYDCSGLVRGVYSVLGIDLMSEPGDADDNGVRLIHHWVARHGENHARKIPQRGDLVYFDNTWDKNGNGRLDDPLTHVGLVEEVGADGTAQVIHRVGRGIARDPMNLLRPHQAADEQRRAINAVLRPKGKREPEATPHLMSELWAGFGTVGVPAGEGRPVAEVSPEHEVGPALLGRAAGGR